MNGKMTALEFIMENIHILRKELEAGNKPLIDIIEHAKQMERDQIENAFNGMPIYGRYLNGEEYYEMVYGKGDKQ